MRAGLRLQILLLLGGLLLFAFVPLYAAVAAYTRVGFERVRASHAQALGRMVAARVSEASATPSANLSGLFEHEVFQQVLEAVVVYDADRRVVRSWGRVSPQLRAFHLGSRETTLELSGAHGRAVAAVVPIEGGWVLSLLGSDDSAARAAPLLRLLGLYTVLVAFFLLLLAYLALTHFIVRPLSELSTAAERVAGGARRLVLPRTRVHELEELGTSLKVMTEKLIAEESALRAKVEEVQAATRRLSDAQDRLVRSERLASVGRLAAGVAHEIGNPLSALIGFEDLLLQGGLDRSEERDFLQRMRRETDRIHGIVRDLLQFSRPSASGLASDAGEPGNVAAAVTDTAALVAPQKEMRAIELAIELEPNLPSVTLSREQLVQVVLNLVLNAADVVGPRGHIEIVARTVGSNVELSVADDGPGVAEAVRGRLFEPFVTTKEPGKGTGLGLAVCRGLVEAGGGAIRLDEGYCGGARFVVELPAAPLEPKSEP